MLAHQSQLCYLKDFSGFISKLNQTPSWRIEGPLLRSWVHFWC